MDLVNFYLGRAPDYKGRMLGDIWAWDHGRLEEVHDYIQVLFPLPEPSMFSSRAPILRDEEIIQFRADDMLPKNLLRSFELMLDFYGLKSRANPLRIEKASSFDERASNWLTAGNHNHLRITRILKCLRICGLVKQAVAFRDCLVEVHREFPRPISPETLDYWNSAVKVEQTESS